MKKIVFIIFILFIIVNGAFCQYDNAIDRGGSYEWEGNETSSWSTIAKGIKILSIPAFIILVIIGLGKDIEKWKDKRKEKKEKIKQDFEDVNRFMRQQRHLNNPFTKRIISELEKMYEDGRITKEQFEEMKKSAENNY